MDSGMKIDVAPLVDLCEKEISKHGFPGAAFAIGNREATAIACVGHFTYAPDSRQVAEDSLFDLASLTKVFATTPSAMLLYDDGRLDLDKPVQDYLKGFVGANKEKITPRNLLLHNSGLPAYANLSKYATKDEARAAVLALPLQAAPGEKTVYSCMSMITLQQVMESILGMPMDAFLKTRLWDPLGMTSTRFNPPASLKERCVPTEDDKTLRKHLIQGEVHDPAAYYCGGLSGNAGLFSTVRDGALYLRMMLDKGEANGKQILCAQTVESWTRVASEASSRGLGWDTRSAEGSSAGRRFSMKSFGHTGYTGTSAWVDPENGIFVLLLTNRVYPDDKSQAMAKFRPEFHDLAFGVLK